MRAKPGRGIRVQFISIMTTILCAGSDFAGAYSGGTGTAADPYRISSVANWQEMTSETRQDKYFVMTTDLDFTGVVMRPVASSSDSGSTSTSFSCVFDGCGHVIRNALFNHPTQSKNVGLFGNLGKTGVVQNLGAENIQVTGYVSLGGLCGYSEGTIRGCYVSGTVTEIEEYWSVRGGLCGTNYGTIENCYANVIIGGEGTNDCGGLCGYNGGIIRTSYSTGILPLETPTFYIGGFCGDNMGIIIDCYWNRDAARVSTSSGGWAMTDIQMKQADTFLGWNNGQWTLDEGQDTPRQAWQAASGNPITTDYPERTYSGSGTETDPFQLTTAADIVSMSLRTPDSGSRFILADDINMAGITHYRPLQDFRGNLDGRRHIIRNLTVSATAIGNRSQLGFLGKIKGATISNLGIEQVLVVGTEYSNCLGGLCGMSYGSIVNCYSTGEIRGWSKLGGLCGYTYGVIRNCFSMCTVAGSTIGGLCGTNLGLIQDSYAAGYMNGNFDTIIGGLIGQNQGKVIRCYSRGTFNELASAGGLCGYVLDDSEDSGNFWDTQASHTETSAMGTGQKTEAMQTFSTFVSADWDFVDTWRLPAGDYPRLRWEEESPLSYGSLQVTIVPSEAAVAEAQWRRVGTSVWFESGQIESSVPAGYWYVEFKAVEGWIPSGTLRILVSPDETTSVQASYREVLFAYGSGTADDPFQIHTIDDWLTLLRDSKDWGKCFVLNHDIDFDGKELTPVAPDTDTAGGFQGIPFTGRFDGQGHILRNVNMAFAGTVYVGLFGCLGSGGTIRNLGVENIRISAISRAGGLVGWNNGGTLIYCHATGFVAGGDSSVAIGGLCGRNDGTIINSYASMAITAGSKSSYLGGLSGRNDAGTIKGSYARGSIISGNDSSYLGGLCGYNSGTLTDCYSTGTVRGDYVYTSALVGHNSSGIIQSCYSSSGVPLPFGYSIEGGLVGYNESGTISSSFWDTTISGQDTGGGIGKTTLEMKTRSTFTTAGWDFVGETSNGTADVWRMCRDGIRYPRLTWETSPEGDFDCPDGVAIEDLLYVVERWMTTTPSGIGVADGNRDGSVSLDDFVSLSNHWMKTNPDQFLVGYWPLDGSLNPEAGTSRGYIIGSGLPTFVSSSSARIGSGAINLSGTHYIAMFGYYGITGSNARTCAAWIKTTSTIAPILYWGKKDSVGGTWEMRVKDNGTLRANFGGGLGINGAVQVNTGQWVHVAMTLPEGSAKVADVQLYVNGIRDAGTIIDGAINTLVDRAYVQVGADETGKYFTGLIDDVRIYDRALTAEEIAQLAELSAVYAGLDQVADLGIENHTTLKGQFTGSWIGTSVSWEQISGPEGGVIADPAALSTTVEFSQVGEYVFRLTATDGIATAIDEVAITVTNGEVGYWKFDGNLLDVLGNHGTAVGDPVFVDASQAKVGTGAVELDGDDAVVVNGFAGITGTAARTTMAWIKTTGTVAPIVYWGDKNSAGAIWDMRVSSLGQLRLVAGSGPTVDSVTKVNTGQWVHVAAVLPEGGNNADDVLLYVNGVLETGGAVTAGTINTKALAAMRIGANEGGNYFTGLIDDVRVYDRALTAEEITAVMNGTE